MATFTTSRAALGSSKASRVVNVAGSGRVARRKAVVLAAKQDGAVDRRQAISGVLLAASSLLAASPAKAFLGFGDDGAASAELYVKETTGLLDEIKAVAVEGGADDERVKQLRKQINNWVAKYRISAGNSGKPSYGVTYAVCNTLAGHYNSFGVDAPLPKKRKERLAIEITDAEKLLARGR